MKRIYPTAIALSAALLLASAASAQVTLNSVRVGAKDSVALAKFYQTAFGMQEVNRIDGQGGPEVFVNFGASTDAAKANKSEPIVIMHRDSDDVKDPIAHVILNVKDMTATVAAIKAAGGSMTGDPRPFRNTGVVIGIAIDPANSIEMIHLRSAAAWVCRLLSSTWSHYRENHALPGHGILPGVALPERRVPVRARDNPPESRGRDRYARRATRTVEPRSRTDKYPAGNHSGP